VLSRTSRPVALALPVLLACILLCAGGWRVHDGRVERVSSTTVPVAAPTVSQPSGPTDQATFLHHLSPSIPWPAWVGLIVLCLLPAVASMVAWSGARRDRSSAFSGAQRAP
jgi:drug/metabolite transporter (DMT)-like permease